MQKLVQLQSELKAPKSQVNSFGKYKYRNLEDIMEAAKPICVKLGLIINVTDELVLIGERYYIRATASIIDPESGEKVSSSAYAREPEIKKGMDESQITGTASSYARKYAMNGLLAIDDTKDADTDEHRRQQDQANNEKEKTANKKINKDKVQAIIDLAKTKGIEIKRIEEGYQKPISDLNIDEWMKSVKRLEEMEDAKIQK